jgi:hypothetical protein
VLVAYLFLQRRLIEGLTAGAVEGQVARLGWPG